MWPRGGFPQLVEKAYRRLVRKHEDRIRSKETVLVIADTLPFQMEILRDGLSHGQVGQRPYEMGCRDTLFLDDLVEGKSVEDPNFTCLDVCTEANHEPCLADWLVSLKKS